jgi:hypothetical protein
VLRVVDGLGWADPPCRVLQGDRGRNLAEGGGGEVVNLALEGVRAWQVDPAPLPAALDPGAPGAVRLDERSSPSVRVVPISRNRFMNRFDRAAEKLHGGRRHP